METVKRTGGRPHAQGTILANLMTERRFKVTRISAALLVSDRQVYNYLTRVRPLTNYQVAVLADLMDMEPEELVDSKGFLRPAKG